MEALFHQGACSDTMESDGRYMMENNYEYSKRLLEWCQDEEVPLIYASSASVYGAGPEFREERRCEKPLNVYGYSKFLFDQYVRGMLGRNTAQVAGFRYFNVYGPNEQHKGRMASVAYHAYHQLLEQRQGEAVRRLRRLRQRRAAARLRLRRRRGRREPLVPRAPRRVGRVSTVGTGRAQTFNELAAAVINAVQGTQLSVQEMAHKSLIEYVPFPPGLIDKYQSFTQADLARLRAAGYQAPFRTVEQGVAAYVAELQKK